MTVRTHRPLALIITYVIFAVLLLIGAAAFWFGLDTATRARFNAMQIATLVILVGFILIFFGVLAASMVRVDERGLTVRNALRTHRIGWSDLRRVVLRDGDPFAIALQHSRDAEGEPRRQAMYGLQSVDRGRTTEAVRQLNLEIERRR